jgi:hypothetical protein
VTAVTASEFLEGGQSAWPRSGARVRPQAAAGVIFIIYSKSGKKQINNFKDKVELIRHRCPHLSSIQIVTDEDFKRGKGFEICSTRRKEAFDKKLQEGLIR